MTQNGMELIWSSLPGRTYRVVYKDDLDAASWAVASADLMAGGESLYWVDAGAGVAWQRFYAVELLPATPPPSPPSITTQSLPYGALSVLYSQTLEAGDGLPPYAWALASGSLPPPLTLGEATGLLSGTPNSAGTYPFTVRVTDARGATATKGFSIYVPSGITPSAFPNLVGWWRADSFNLADNTPIGGAGCEWIDESSAGRNATQSTSGAQPSFRTNIFGNLPAIEFDGTDDFLNFSSWNATSFTVIAVYKHRSTSASGMLLGRSSGLDYQLRSNFGGENNIVFYCTGTVWASQDFSTPADAVRMASYIVQSSGMDGTVSFRENTTARGGSVNVYAGSAWESIGRIVPGYYFDGYLAELCLYATNLSAADLDSLYDNYFKSRWGLP
jgi:hypothetical protein